MWIALNYLYRAVLDRLLSFPSRSNASLIYTASQPLSQLGLDTAREEPSNLESIGKDVYSIGAQSFQLRTSEGLIKANRTWVPRAPGVPLGPGRAAPTPAPSCRTARPWVGAHQLLPFSFLPLFTAGHTGRQRSGVWTALTRPGGSTGPRRGRVSAEEARCTCQGQP